MRRRRRAYPTDLTDAQWAAIAELVPAARPGGRPRRASPREIGNAILYMLRGGQAWRLTDPERAAEARALLRGRFAPAPARSLKDLLASAPLDGVELDRSRDPGRVVDL